MVSLKSLGDIMKNQRILRRKKHEKLMKKRIKRTTRNKNIKEHEKNIDKLEKELRKKQNAG